MGIQRGTLPTPSITCQACGPPLFWRALASIHPHVRCTWALERLAVGDSLLATSSSVMIIELQARRQHEPVPRRDKARRRRERSVPQRLRTSKTKGSFHESGRGRAIRGGDFGRASGATAGVAHSRRTSLALVPSLNPTNLEGRRWFSPVHSRNSNRPPSTGESHWHSAILACVRPWPQRTALASGRFANGQWSISSALNPFHSSAPPHTSSQAEGGSAYRAPERGVAHRHHLSTPGENLTDRRGDEPQDVTTS
jgi:hypothetical protein